MSGAAEPLHLVYGGTFDPIHCGHLAIACAARDALGCTVRLMPAGDPPHRAAPGADAETRAAMVALAIEGMAGLMLDRSELDRGGRSYTVDTLAGLRDTLGPSAPIAWLVGADSLLGLTAWHRSRRAPGQRARRRTAGRPRHRPGPALGHVAGRAADAARRSGPAPASAPVPRVGNRGAGAPRRGRFDRRLAAGAGGRIHPREGLVRSRLSRSAIISAALSEATLLSNPAHVIKTRLPEPPPSPDALLEVARAAVAEIKAVDVIDIDVRGRSSVCDFMVIASGTSSRHVKSIADEVVKHAKKLGCQPLGVEGEREAEWVLVDLGDVVVHVMLPRVREFYALERLWTVGDEPPAEDRGPRRDA